MSHFDDFAFYRLTVVPKLADDEAGRAGRQAAVSSIGAALEGTHASLLADGNGGSLVSCWLTTDIDAEPGDDVGVQILLGGRPFLPLAVATDAREERRTLLYPPGAVGSAVATDEVAARLDKLPWWVPCAGRTDALWLARGSGPDPVRERHGTFEAFATHLGSPFAWMVVAEPMPAAELQPALDQLANEILPLTRSEVGETKRVRLERSQARHRELSRAQAGGAWRVRLLVGSDEPRSATTAAGMMCAASELHGHPFALAPGGPPQPLVDALQVESGEAYDAGVPFVATTGLLAALTRPPDRELPGLRVVEDSRFDLTMERDDPTGLPLGRILNDAGNDVGRLNLRHDSLNRHTFVCGATGSGKTVSVQHLLSQATAAGLPWMVIEPAKAEYAGMAGRLAAQDSDLIVIRPGDPSGPPAGLNPLEPAPGFPLQTHADLLRALFLAAFESHEPFPQILASALVRSYEESGWDLTLGEPTDDGVPRYPTLGDLEQVAARVVSEIGYGPEVAADVHGFIKVRLSSLRLGTTGRFFEGGHPLDFARLMEHNVVLEIEDVGDDADKAFLMGAVLLRLTEHLRVRARGDSERGLRHLTVVEEAHRLLRRPENGASGASSHAVEMFAGMLAEIRAYGEGLIIAEQIPGKLNADVIKNTAVKLVHRLPAQDDRESVGATMNLQPAQSRRIVALEPGRGVLFTDGMDRPLMVQVPAPGDPGEPRPPASVDGIIGRRSPTCGDACLAEACTLRQMREAQHLLGPRQSLVLWAELVVVAHLAAHRTPRLAEDLLRQLRNADRRIVDCALSHSVDAAVNSRSASLRPWQSGDELARHCVDALRQVVADHATTDPCLLDDYAYVSTLDQWVAIKSYIEEESPDDPRDPRTQEWERQTGRMIPGQTRREQREAVIAFRDLAYADRAARDLVTFGESRPSTLEQAVGSPETHPLWAQQVMQAVAAFPNVGWIQDYLVPAPSASNKGAPRE